MNKWKVAFFAVLCAGLATNTYLLYHLIDSGVSYSYLHDSYTSESRRFYVLSELVVAGSEDYTKADILHLLRQANEDAFIVEDNEIIQFQGINFMFVNDKLTNVE